MNKRLDISPLEIFKVLWQGKKFLILITSISSILIVLYALSLPNLYISNTILASSNAPKNLSSSLSGLKSLAGAAGISIPSDADSMDEAINIVRSHYFFENEILPNINLIDLMAAESWDPSTNSVIYDEKEYNTSSQKWIRNVSYPKKIIPSSQEAHLRFLSDHFSLSRDKETGFLSLSVVHFSPNIAYEWINIVVNNLRELIRAKERKRSQELLNFLEQKYKETSLNELRNAITFLMQRELEQLAIIESSEEYAFKTIVEPIAPEFKFAPRRAIICIVGAIFGFIFGCLYLIIIHLRRAN